MPIEKRRSKEYDGELLERFGNMSGRLDEQSRLSISHAEAIANLSAFKGNTEKAIVNLEVQNIQTHQAVLNYRSEAQGILREIKEEFKAYLHDAITGLSVAIKDVASELHANRAVTESWRDESKKEIEAVKTTIKVAIACGIVSASILGVLGTIGWNVLTLMLK